MLHAAAWFAWLSAALIVVSTTRNPLYLTLALAAFITTARAIRRPGETSAAPLAPGRFALYVIPLAALLNALLSRTGETILIAIPSDVAHHRRADHRRGAGLRRTQRSGADGALHAFTVLNLAVPVRDLIRFIPRAFYPVAVVASIAVTFASATLRQMQGRDPAKHRPSAGTECGGCAIGCRCSCRCSPADWSARCNWPRP